ncbi:MAG: ATP-binding protein [Candidatus Methylomirabilia bacterium]
MSYTGFKGLGIRAKTLLALALTLGFGVSVLVLTLRGFLMSGFERSEEKELLQALRGVTGRVAVLLDDLAAATADYAAGDDISRLEGGAGADPLLGRFTAARLTGGRIALAALFDARGALVGGGALGPAPPAFSPLPAAFREYLRDNPGLFARTGHPDGVKGILPLGPSPLLVASRPVDGGDSAGDGRSALLFGRYLEGDLMLGMATSGGVPEFILAGAGVQPQGEAREALAALTAGEALFVSRRNAQIMTGYTLVRDLAGAPAYLLRLNLDRSGYASGLLSLKILMVAFGLVLLATGGTYILLIEWTVLRRVIRLGASVQRVGSGSAAAEGIVADGPDEIGKLAQQVRDAFVSRENLKRELEEAREALERRVEDRTRDLRATVDALGGEIAVRRQAEAQVRDLEQHQRAVIDNMVGGLVTFDENLLVTRVNPAALALLRASPASLGRPLARLLPEPFAADIAGEFRGAEPTVERRETRVVFADGRELVLGYVLSRIPPSEGRGAQGIVLFRDLTAERRLAAEQQRLNRLTTLGEFSAQVAHELRNPLTAMSSTVQYLAAASEGRDREMLRIITESIERMDGIIRRMRLLSREMPLARTSVDLGDLLAHLLAFLEASLRGQGVVPLFRPPAVSLLVSADPAQLHQALLNLLMNAMQAMPRGGKLRLRLARARRPADGGPPPAMILIADSGAGIPPEVAGRIFDPFYTTREAGTGLGLPIADKIVREHGGTIRFTSRPGHGACFAVLLPGEQC